MMASNIHPPLYTPTATGYFIRHNLEKFKHILMQPMNVIPYNHVHVHICIRNIEIEGGWKYDGIKYSPPLNTPNNYCTLGMAFIRLNLEKF